MKIEIGIPTKDRYPNLAILLWSLCEQEYTDWVVTIVDDSEDMKDIRELDYMLPILRKLDRKGHSWRVELGYRKGPHYCHQLILDKSRCDYIWRIDDDEIADRNCLQELVEVFSQTYINGKRIGAVGPIVIDPSVEQDFEYLPLGYQSFRKYQGKINEYGENFGEQQWRRHPDDKLQEVEHLYSSFLYNVEIAKEIGGYDLNYNKVGHREETDFTYRIWLKGYSLVVNPKGLIWHLRASTGGIRN